MRLHELLDTITQPSRGNIGNNPMVVLMVRWNDTHGIPFHFVYQGAVVCAMELCNLPQEIRDKEVLSVKKGERGFGLTRNNSIVFIDYTIEIPF